MTRAAIFLDTSVLHAALEPNAPAHAQARGYVERLHASKIQGWISRQVLREFMAVQTRPQPYAGALSGPMVADQVERMRKLFKVADETEACTEALMAYLVDGRAVGKQVHDAGIVATMKAYGLKRLATLNEAHFRRFGPDIELEKIPLA